jgi:hypothetical protein
MAPLRAAMAGLPALTRRPDRPHRRSGDPAASALAAAARTRLDGPVFNAEGFGGYLTFRGIPSFIDGRAELYGNAFLDQYLAAEGGSEQALAALLDAYGITWTLLAPQQGAVARVDALPGWRRVYADAIAVVHVRSAANPGELCCR